MPSNEIVTEVKFGNLNISIVRREENNQGNVDIPHIPSAAAPSWVLPATPDKNIRG